MIQERTILKVFDNSGAKIARCFKILKGFKKKYANTGDIIIVSIQQLRNKSKKMSKVKKKEIYKALIIKTNVKFSKKNGYKQIFKNNGVVLLNKQESPIGTRILGALPKSFKKKNLQKFISISAGLI